MLISKSIKLNLLVPCVLFQNHYETMGLHKRSSQQEIKERYLQLAKLHHPDVLGSQKPYKPFSQINIAYEILKDEEKRREYDRILEQEKTYKTAWYYEEAKSYGSRYEPEDLRAKTGKQNVFSRILSAFMLLVSLPLTIYYLVEVRPKPTEYYIRRENLIMSRYNIDSSPSAQKKRAEMYYKYRIQKQFRIVHVDKKLNRHKNAFLSEEHVNNPEKRGKTMSGTPPPNYNILETIEGVTKMQKYVKSSYYREAYM